MQAAGVNEIVEENEEIEPSLVWDINYENHCESCQEDALDRYLEYGTENEVDDSETNRFR